MLGACLLIFTSLSVVHAQPVPDPEPTLRALLELAQGELQETQRGLDLLVQEARALAEQRLQRVLTILQEAQGILNGAAQELVAQAEAAVAAAQAALLEAQAALDQAARDALTQAQAAIATAQAALQEVPNTVSQAAQDAIARAQAETAAAQALLQETAQQALARAEAELAAALAALQEAPNTVSQAAQAALTSAQAEVGRLAAEVEAAAEGPLAAAKSALAQAEAHARSSARAALLAGPVVVWTSLNMGPDSGLDADLLDGFQARDFLDRIAAEAAARAAEDAALRQRIDTLKLSLEEAIAAEAAAREAGQSRLADALAGEAASRRADVARLDGLLDREASDRAAADAAEARSREAADGALHARVDGVEAGIPERAWSAVLARDGPGSTLDADTLDGLGSGQLLRSDRSGSLAGSLALAGELSAAAITAAGGVRFGDDAAACSREKAGTLRFRDGHFEGCDGSAWRRLDSTPPPAASCKAIKDATPSASSGIYTIDPNGGDAADAFKAYCDMTTGGGGWTLLLQASSSSAYLFGHAVWTASSAPATNVPDPGIDQDKVSPAFYALSGVESMLCMGDLGHCAAWDHVRATARALANGSPPPSSQASASVCSTFKCGPNTLPAAIRDATPGTTAGAWHRWGYQNFDNSWGTRTRVGFTGDNDSSDSADTVIGLGIECFSSCRTNAVTDAPHDTGSGYYKYFSWSTAPHDGPLKGFLFIR